MEALVVGMPWAVGLHPMGYPVEGVVSIQFILVVKALFSSAQVRNLAVILFKRMLERFVIV